MRPPRRALPCLVAVCASVFGANGLALPRQVKQTPEVVEAYAVCESFEHLLGEDLDFDRAYEATFTRDAARRRAIAVAEGEFGLRGTARVGTDLLVRAYKLRTQIFYLTLVLLDAGEGVKDEASLIPPDLGAIIERKPPAGARAFRGYVSQLGRDVARFRAHFGRLVAENPSVAARFRKFKSETLAARLAPPADHKVEPLRGYYRSGVLGAGEDYYEVDGCVVARERGRMRIVGLRFFNRLF